MQILNELRMVKGVFIQKSDDKIEVRIIKKLGGPEKVLQYFDLILQNNEQAIVIKEILQFEVTC